MNSWKAFGIITIALISTKALAEDKGSYENSMMMITMAPTFLLSGTTGLSELATRNFKPAKADALAFIGSDGEIRGAQLSRRLDTTARRTARL
ncbi:DUF2388 domain-containing protein [Pseudomonas sp. MWU12-2115]|uniref:DUF2388 domain-containing protein n=1 Tax=unclassified Pseudomonas TaxID=196821 RepID=UPI003221DD6C